MTKAVRIAASLPASAEKSDEHPIVPIALFSGIGLLVSLIAIITGVQGAWY